MLKKELAIVILNWNGTDDTIECLRSLNINKELYDIFLLDNASETAKREQLVGFLAESGYSYSVVTAKEYENSAFIPQELNLVLSENNLGYARGNNYIANKIYPHYGYILLLNNDTEVPPETIPHMLKEIRHRDDAAITCDIRYYSERDSLWNAGGKLKWYGDRKYFSQNIIDKKIRNGISYIRAEFITGCALLIDSRYIAQFGLYTEKFFHGEEDYNFCYLAKKRGKSLGVDLSVRLYHKVGRSINFNGNSARALRAMVVHYTNRVLDYKELYGKFRWRLWKGFYLFLVRTKRKLAGMDRKKLKTLMSGVKFYTAHYDDVRYEVFCKIMNDDTIK